MIASEGQRVDQFYTHQPKQAEAGILSLLKIRFDYLECNGGCGTTLETSRLTQATVEEWRFNLMGLKPSILGTAHGTCPICQDLQKQFSQVLR
jgi:hypothetical protein